MSPTIVNSFLKPIALLALMASAAMFGLGAMVALSESHAATPMQIWGMWLQLAIALGTILGCLLAATVWHKTGVELRALGWLTGGQLGYWALVGLEEMGGIAWARLAPLWLLVSVAALLSMILAWWSLVRAVRSLRGT
jgi:hypothetical protein